MTHRLLIYIILLFYPIFAQGIWYSGNLKGIDDFSMELNVKGIDDSVWEKRVSSVIMLRFLENDIRIVKANIYCKEQIKDIADQVFLYLVLLIYYKNLNQLAFPYHLKYQS